MKRISITLILLFINAYAFSQVAIGTTNPSRGSAFQIDSETGALVPPRMTRTQMENIQDPLEGAMVFNTTSQELFTFNGVEWNEIVRSLPTIVMNRKDSGSFTLGVDDYYQFPVSSSQITHTDNDYYSIESAGRIRILQDGVYKIATGMSTNSISAGNRKFVISVYKNGTSNSALIGYPTRGEINILTNDPVGNYWGTSGVLTYQFNANDLVNIRYVINRDAGANNDQTAPIKFVNLGITKIN